MSTSEPHLSPSETASRLGVSVKALRLYGRHGLVAPLRSEAGWRTYGPAQIARLHQILALKRLGLPVVRIGELLSGRMATLGEVLGFQERMLAEESARLGHALALVRAARWKLGAGGALSIDDLTQLTMETTMTTKATPDELKTIFEPISAKYFSPAESVALSKRKFDQEATSRSWETLIEEARALSAKGDPTSPAAMNLARRWRAGR